MSAIPAPDAARGYLAYGWMPVPIVEGTKKPAMACWEDLRLQEDQIRTLWSNGEGVGLLLGEPSGGLVDVDLDCPEALRAADLILPLTTRVHGRRSAPTSHRWYLCDPIPEKVFRFKDPGGNTLVELRSTGGQTIVPPTVHPSGEALRWEGEGEPAPVDGEVLRHRVQQLAAVALLARNWPKKGRHDASMALAGALLGAGWGRHEASLFIRAVCAGARDEEVEDRLRAVQDTEETIKVGGPATGMPTLADIFGEAVTQRLSKWIGLSHSVDSAFEGLREWSDPIPLDEPEPDRIPVDALPPVLRAHVVSVANATQTPADMALPLALAAVAVCVQGKVIVEIRSGWTEPVNIYAISVAPPASRKSAVFDMIFSPLNEWEVEQARKEAPDRQAMEDRREVMEKRLEAAKRDAAKGGPLELVEAARLELLNVKVPPITRLNAPEATPEALVPLMAEQGGRLAIWGPEGDPLDMAAGRYSGQGEARLDVLKKAWTGGETIRTDRISRAGHHIRRPALTLALCIQPSVLETLRNARSFVGEGVFGRILWAFPKDKIGNRLTGPAVPSLDMEAAKDWDQLLRRLLETSPADVDDDGTYVPHVLRFTPDALDVLYAFEHWVEEELGSRGRLSGIQHWSGKLVGNTVRVAALLHLARTAEDVWADLWGHQISSWAMRSAIEVSQALCSHALRVFAALEADPKVTLARHVYERAEELPEGSTVRDLFNAVRGKKGLGTVGNLNQVLSLLEEHSLLRRRKQVRKGPGRTPSPLIELNPDTTQSIRKIRTTRPGARSDPLSADFADENRKAPSETKASRPPVENPRERMCMDPQDAPGLDLWTGGPMGAEGNRQSEGREGVDL